MNKNVILPVIVIIAVIVSIYLLLSQPWKDNKSTACRIQNCHGMEITCGSEELKVCTEMYEIGDRCRVHATCAVVDGSCQVKEDSLFKTCKLCVSACEARHRDDTEALFQCESECQ